MRDGLFEILADDEFQPDARCRVLAVLCRWPGDRAVRAEVLRGLRRADYPVRDRATVAEEMHDWGSHGDAKRDVTELLSDATVPVLIRVRAAWVFGWAASEVVPAVIELLHTPDLADIDRTRLAFTLSRRSDDDPARAEVLRFLKASSPDPLFWEETILLTPPASGNSLGNLLVDALASWDESPAARHDAAAFMLDGSVDLRLRAAVARVVCR